MNTKTNIPLFKTGFLAGLAAGIVATASMLILNIVFAGLSLPEVVGSALTAIMPASVFDYLHQTIGADAKHYLFDGIVVGQCLVFAFCGGAYNLLLAAWHNRSTTNQKNTEKPFTIAQLPYYYGLLLAAILWLLVGLIFLPLLGAGVFG